MTPVNHLDASERLSGKSAGTGIQSVEVGAALLRALVDSQGPMALTRLAAAAGMPPGKAHKYLASYIRIGLVTRDRDGARYDLGPFALEMGLASLRRGDLMSLAQAAIDDLRDRLGTTASVAVWANKGVTLVRWAETSHITSPTVRLGVVLPILVTATGRVFGAYLDPRMTRAAVEQELSEPQVHPGRKGLDTLEQAEALFAKVRVQGFASAEGTPEAGRSSIAAPVFNANNEIVAALAIVGVQGVIDLTAGGQPVQALVQEARGLSTRLGSTR